jgi:hypothetical protein
MNFYHIVPPNMQGGTLLSLSSLKHEHPDVYNQAVSKYIGREDLLNTSVDVLDCTWQDVIFLTTIHPDSLRNGLLQAGSKNAQNLRFYVIPEDLLDMGALAVTDGHRDGKCMLYEDIRENEVIQILPEATADYYQYMFAQDKRPLIFFRTQHFLYKGTIDITDADII